MLLAKHDKGMNMTLRRTLTTPLAALGLAAALVACSSETDTVTQAANEAVSNAAQTVGMAGPGSMEGTEPGMGDRDMGAPALTRGPDASEPIVPKGSVEVVLKDRLDGDLSEYCFDIVGGGRNINPADGLQAHTCYSYRGALGSDQATDPALFAGGIIKISAFDVCAVATNPKAGDKLALTACDGSDAQTFDIDAQGHIRPSGDPSLCMTAGESTVRGRNGTSPHQIKTLTMENCNADKAAYQQWRTRNGDD